MVTPSEPPPPPRVKVTISPAVNDAAVAVVLVSGLAVGVLLVSASGGYSIDLFSFLFGSILLISDQDVIMVVVISSAVIGTLCVLEKQFLHLTFNEEQAKIGGLNVTVLNYLFVVLAAVTVVISMKLVGILLISSLIVIPNISAMMFGKGFKKTVGISMALSTLSVVTGIFLSYSLDLSPSGTIVMVSVACLIGVIIARHVGIISRSSTSTSSKAVSNHE